MVKLNKIYTRTGDKGETGLGDGTRLPKHAPRVSAYGEVDETNAVIGLAIVAINADKDLTTDLAPTLVRIQNDLFDLGADLCTPDKQTEESAADLRITPEQVTALEQDIDNLNSNIAPLTSFVLPGGTAAAAHLHHARTVARRAERMITAMAAQESINPNALNYINRLSDLLFVMARYVNKGSSGDILWKPGGDR
ncbi:MAG: cob(I)yrinic acid a,c-diamide adenosyltransferase [Alphaproteobacteria bacterium]|nr:cob(I)yrinic acid a,c-diamide adenosyltransferase [Alphaproteobacteria bacterium]